MERNRKFSLLIPALVALVFSLVGSLLWLLLENIGGRLGAPSPQAATDGLYVALLFLQLGYFVAAAPQVTRAGITCFEAVEDHLNTQAAELPFIRARFTESRRSGLPWAVLPALALTVALQEMQFARFSAWWASPGWSLGEFWTVLAAWATWSTAFWLIARVVVDASAIRRLGEHCVVIDLMRIEPLVAFSRYGLYITGLVVGIIALWMIIAVGVTAFLAPGDTVTAGQVLLLMTVLYLSVTLAAFVYPQLGIRRSMRSQKDRVSQQVTLHLPVVRDDALAVDIPPDRLDSLLTLRSHIQSLPDWPIGQHTRLRLGLYLFVPLLSWVAAALVEELVSKFLL